MNTYLMSVVLPEYPKQVLSESVSKALMLTGGSEAQETARLVLYMDKFFDGMNVTNFTTGIHQRKSFQLPYRSATDFRLKVILQYITHPCIMCISICVLCVQWLEEEFLSYLEEWKGSVAGRPGFTAAQKQKMLLSPATLLGLQMSGIYVHTLIL